MVVKITSPHSIKRALNYNEQKVIKGMATCIAAEGFLLSLEKLNFYQKLDRFTDLISLNERSKKSNTLHISLNFDPRENIEKEKLLEIAKTYMTKIGFEKQPYLVYEHRDAGHPHIHIVTTNIQSNGKRIDTYNIGRNQSEKARKEIELVFGLIVAAKKTSKLQQRLSESVKRVSYGKSETRQSITNVLNLVIEQFKFTSLPELNAVLSQFNVVADRGAEGGRIFKNGGLTYRLLDENGNKVGVPIKASLIYSQPTLKNLQDKFATNGEKREPDKPKLKSAILFALAKKPTTLQEFTSILKKDNISTIIRQNDEGRLYGITFVDFRSKAVFKGSDLGKQFSIVNIQNAIAGKDIHKHNSIPDRAFEIAKESPSDPLVHSANKLLDKGAETGLNAVETTIAEIFSRSDINSSKIPFELIKKRKKRKKPNSHN
ncbi:MAG: relaxase/mobilization nuclease domain-containing protein [Chitinophagaceae bacterium]